MMDELLQEMIDPAPQRGDVSRWRRLGATAAIFALAGLGVTSLTTSALFTDRDTTAGDLLTGTVDLRLGTDANGTADFVLPTLGMAPGDSVARQLEVHNDGSLAQRYAVSYKADTTLLDPSLTPTAPTLGTGETFTGTEDIRTWFTLDVFPVTPTATCVQTPNTPDATAPAGLVTTWPLMLGGFTPILGDATVNPFQPASGVTGSPGPRTLGVSTADNVETLCVRATFDADAGNAFQGKGVSIALRFDAEQVVNNPTP